LCNLKLDDIEFICTADYCEYTYVYKMSCTTGGSNPGSPSGPALGGGGPGGGPQDPDSIPSIPIGGDDGYEDPWEEPTIENFKVNTTEEFKNLDKINCTYNQLLKTTSIPEILIDFFGDDALNNVTFDVKEDLVCNGNISATGCTTPLGGNDYKIDIDKDYITDSNTPTIFLAQTLVHEAIHANLYAAVKKLNNGATPTDTSFESLYEDYRQLQGWQHDYIADHYTGIMQEAIKEVHPNLNDGQFFDWYEDNADWNWDEFYEYISYRGLDDTDNGVEYFENTDNISFYSEGAEAFSTKQPNCD